MIDNLNPDSKFKAINVFIFAGSFSIGVMKAGFHLDRVLEISDTQPEENAFYFIKNSSIPVILPSTWENNEYLSSLKDVDLMCANCPCSSLSQINRNASVGGKNNIHFYRLFKMFNLVQPKAFVIENAPTLIKLGFPILKDAVEQLGDKYRFTIIRDYAGNHNVAMRRMRTLLVGWNRKYFDKIPKVKQNKKPMPTVKDMLHDLYEDTTEDYLSKTHDSIKHLYKYCPAGESLMTGLAKQVMNDNHKEEILSGLKDTPFLREVNRIIDKISNNKNFWDKSPYKLDENGVFPSFTSVMEYIHPLQDRMLNLKEMGRIMNYPDEYSFEGTCKVPTIQAMAQGVPANFGQYIAEQVKLALENKLDYYNSGDVAFQHHTHHTYNLYTKEEFMNLTFLDSDKTSQKLIDEKGEA